MGAQLLQVGRFLTLALAASALAFTIGRFPQATKHYSRASLWLLYWTFLGAQYVISIVSTFTATRETYGFMVGVIVCDIAQSASLLLVAHRLPRRSESLTDPRATSTSLVAEWLVLALALGIVSVAVVNPWGPTRAWLQAGFALCALGWLGLRWAEATRPKSRMYLSLFLLLYGIDYFEPFGFSPKEGTPAAAVRSFVVLIIYAVVAYLCAATLRSEEGLKHRMSSADADSANQPSTTPAAAATETITELDSPTAAARAPVSGQSSTESWLPPELKDNFKGSLSDKYLLLYIIARKSGRFGLVIAAALALSAVLAALDSLVKIASLLRGG